jgi:hypothetical protein
MAKGYTQNDKILKYMKTHKKGITALKALEICGCLRLSGRIFDLRKQGYEIKREMIAVRGEGGDTKYVARYSLEG